MNWIFRQWDIRGDRFRSSMLSSLRPSRRIFVAISFFFIAIVSYMLWTSSVFAQLFRSSWMEFGETFRISTANKVQNI
jgi:hypothetical protein